jgi:hypothetical protein
MSLIAKSAKVLANHRFESPVKLRIVLLSTGPFASLRNFPRLFFRIDTTGAQLGSFNSS